MMIARVATAGDAPALVELLCEAAHAFEMWSASAFDVERVQRDMQVDGVEYLLFVNDKDKDDVLGCCRLSHDDPDYWGDVDDDADGDASVLYVHRVVVRRRHAGRGLSLAILDEARRRASAAQCSAMRLDCSVLAPKLIALYERFGFRRHSVLERSGTYDVQRFELSILKLVNEAPQ